jgi:branched-chain amino acid transport system permease protein
VGIYVVLAVGLNIVAGFAGLLSCAQAAFFGLGAYCSALLALNFGMSFWLALPLSGIFAGFFGILLGLPTIRLAHFYLVMATIGFGEIVGLVFLNWESLTKGPFGLPGIPPPSIGSFVYLNNMPYYYTILVLASIGVYVAWRLTKTQLGKIFVAIKDDQMAVEACGVHVNRYKILAFAMSAVYAGVAGSFFAHYMTYISPGTFSTHESIMILAMVVLGGMGSVAGTVVSAAVLTIIPEALRFIQDYRMMFFGGVIILLMLIKPEGLMGKGRYSLRKRIGGSVK